MGVLDGHTDMNLAGRYQIDDHTVAVERPENACKEPMRNAFPVRVYVQDDNAFLNCDCRGELLVTLVNHL